MKVKKYNLERLIVCSETDAWNIFQPNRKTPTNHTVKKISDKSYFKEKELVVETPEIFMQFKKQRKLDPEREEIPKIPLSTNIRPNPKMSIEPCFLYSLQESHQIIPPFKIELKPNKA